MVYATFAVAYTTAMIVLHLILHSALHIYDFQSRSLDSRCWISVFVSITWILDSNRQQDSKFLQLNSGFQSMVFRIPQQKFRGFWDPNTLTMNEEACMKDTTSRTRFQKTAIVFMLRFLLYNIDVWHQTMQLTTSLDLSMIDCMCQRSF